MTAFNKTLKKLDSSVPTYIKKVGKFQLKKATYELNAHYHAEFPHTCSICGKPNIIDIYEIRNIKTGKLRDVGNVCIKKITNMRIGRWFDKYVTKHDRLLKWKPYIDGIEEVLKWRTLYSRPRSKLREMLYRLTEEHKNLTKKQREYFDEKFLEHLTPANRYAINEMDDNDS